MSWNTFHHRGETLRTVVDTANERRDGVLPMDVPGVTENFAGQLDLVGALMLKWHARLSGNLERALAREPMDLEAAVASAWLTTAQQLPGVRIVIDRCLDFPEGDEMEHAMRRARVHERARLATAAGLASGQGDAAVEAGRQVEERARLGLAEAGRFEAGPVEAAAPAVDSAPAPAVSFVDRIRAVLAA